MEDRIKTLQDLTGMTVKLHQSRGVNYFQFLRGKQTIKTICTYPKAKAFAEGVAVGLLIGSKYHTPC